MMCPQTWERWE